MGKSSKKLGRWFFILLSKKLLAVEISIFINQGIIGIFGIPSMIRNPGKKKSFSLCTVIFASPVSRGLEAVEKRVLPLPRRSSNESSERRLCLS